MQLKPCLLQTHEPFNHFVQHTRAKNQVFHGDTFINTMLPFDYPARSNFRKHRMKAIADASFLSEETRISSARHEQGGNAAVWLKLPQNVNYNMGKRRFKGRFRRFISLYDFER